MKIKADDSLDITVVVCPMTFVKTKMSLEELADGQILSVHLNDGEPIQNVPRSLKDEGHKVISVEQQADGSYELLVKKGGAFIAMKGPDCGEEVREAKRGIAMLGGRLERVADYTVPGTDITHSAVIIRKVNDTPPKYPRRWAQIKKQPL